MKFTLEIDCNNAAFGNDEDPMERRMEIARILRAVADKMYDGYDKCVVRDSNGNSVGHFDTVAD